MPTLAKLTLSASSPTTGLSLLERKRLRLLQRLDIQHAAAEAEIAGEHYAEAVTRWVKHKDTGEKTLITQHRSVRRWWWQDQTGKWIITLRDGNRVLPVNVKTPSIEVGDRDQLPTVLLALIEAVKAGDLDACLKQAVERQKR